MPLEKRPMHRHNICVTLSGPAASLDHVWQDQLRDRIIGIVGSRGFPRDSQRRIKIAGIQEEGNFQLDISVTDAAAEMMTAQQSESIEAELLAATQHFLGPDVVLGKKWQRHPTPEGALIVI